MQDFRKVRAWQEAMALADMVYEAVGRYPPREFGLIDQIKRAVDLISANIAEGCGRRTKKELVHFLFIAMGSAFELESRLLSARRRGFIPDDACINRTIEIKKILWGLIRAVNGGRCTVNGKR